MPHGRQQRGVDPPQPREVLGVGAVVLRRARGDQAHPSGVGHDHLMAQLGQQPMEPGRVRPHFQDDPTPGYQPEATVHGPRRRAHPRLLDHRAAGVHHADLTPRVPDVDPDRLPRRRPRCAPVRHAGLLPAWADPGRARLAARYVPALREATGLLIPAFNPSVRGSNPRGPTSTLFVIEVVRALVAEAVVLARDVVADGVGDENRAAGLTQLRRLEKVLHDNAARVYSLE